MSVNLQKGQKVDLTKTNHGLSKIVIGLGWDEADQKKKSLFKKVQPIDCDASALLLSADGKIHDQNDVIYYNHLVHESGSVKHMGDNLTGEGDGDDEQITVELNQVPANVEKIIFVVTIYQATKRGQHFGMINNAFIRIVNSTDNSELCKYNLSENYNGMTAMIFGELYRHQGEWKFNAIGQPTNDDGISQMSKRYI